MSANTTTTEHAGRPGLGKASTLARFALIGVALAADAGTFAYLGGWFAPAFFSSASAFPRIDKITG
jgi:hypothetical protein